MATIPNITGQLGDNYQHKNPIYIVDFTSNATWVDLLASIPPWALSATIHCKTAGGDYAKISVDPAADTASVAASLTLYDGDTRNIPLRNRAGDDPTALWLFGFGGSVVIDITFEGYAP